MHRWDGGCTRDLWPLLCSFAAEKLCLMLIDKQMRLESFENKHQNKRDQTQALKINAIRFLNDVWVAIINIVCRLMRWWVSQEVMCVQNPVKQTKLLHEINYVIRTEIRLFLFVLFRKLAESFFFSDQNKWEAYLKYSIFNYRYSCTDWSYCCISLLHNSFYSWDYKLTQ